MVITLDVLYAKNKKLYFAHVSKSNSNLEEQVTL